MITSGKLITALIFVGALSFAAMGQTSDSVVQVRPAISFDKVRQGSSFGAAVVLEIQNGYHINSNRPTEAYLIATVLDITPANGFTPGPRTYPAGSMKKFSFSAKPLSVYEGRAIIRFTVRAARNVPTGRQTIKGKLKVQACNDRACLAPKVIDVEIPVEVTGPSDHVNPANGDLFNSTPSKRH